MKTPCDVGKSLRATDSFGAETPASQRDATRSSRLRSASLAPLESQNAPVFCQFRFSNLHCYFSILLFCQIHFSCLPTPFCQIVASNCYFLILLFWEVYFSCLPTLFCQILNSTFLFSYFANFVKFTFPICEFLQLEQIYFKK